MTGVNTKKKTVGSDQDIGWGSVPPQEVLAVDSLNRIIGTGVTPDELAALALQDKLPVTLVKTSVEGSPYTVLATDRIILADADSGPLELDLPASLLGRRLTIVRINSVANNVTIDQNGAENINGSAVAVDLIAQYDQLDLVGSGISGNEWIKLTGSNV